MKPLIVYFSRTGNNEELAMQLQKRLNCPARAMLNISRHRSKLALIFNTIFAVDSRIIVPEIDFEAYDRFILVAPIWAGSIPAPMQTFIRKNKQLLRSVSFATICGGQPGQREKIRRQLARLLSKEPVTLMELTISELFGSANPKKSEQPEGYHLQQSDWTFFDRPISQFVTNVAAATPEKPETRSLSLS
jgi:menaquinone-dependent protoporphyrinogen IX oxidase